MPSTHFSLLTAAQAGSDQAWSRLVDLYRPLLYRWLRRHDVPHDDAEELTQEVLAVVVQEIGRFEHNGRLGGFRRWLREITLHRALGFLRGRRLRVPAVGGSTFLAQTQQQIDSDDILAQQWDREFDQQVLAHLMQAIESELEPVTRAAFRLVALEDVPAEQAAERLGISVGAVYSAKSRVLRRLRQAAAGLVDDELLR
jgi:RNA polymerase sigma-70 factor (ECF subfamily)